MKPKWGTKRVCPECGVRFYDLGRTPITCPSCNGEFEAEVFVRGRRSRGPLVSEGPKVAAVKPPPDEPVAAESEARDDAPSGDGDADATPAADKTAAIDTEDEDEAEDDEDALIEDASELGEDEDDVAEVMDKVADEKES